MSYDDTTPPRWEMTVAEARTVQQELRERLIAHPPAGFAPRWIAGADVSMERFSHFGHAALVVLDAQTLAVAETATAEEELRFPYVPGYLSFRELPPLHACWERLAAKPDLVVFDGQGYAHPRRFGLACHGGVLWDVPTIGCAKTLLVGEHGELGMERGDTAPLIHKDEVVGMAVRTRDGTKPVYVSAGHRMDLATAVEWVLRLSRFRLPETTRHAHAVVNDLRRARKTE
ncbi:deoxyribonuclease V [Longimicrobium terrae]|uniref:Endonuclease V n=1 Tax=Longimicrobium terrae TaxID=1639882 RepID=A0A841GZE4_9BACT|nr:deoxyribonuclease V [Longimicrobium terrae]MBB4636398.1 deoxyribonuclease V [Longimicrobium terrae]MBB6071078.1 deoxyribonuclease V [Longimicrobium terrae]NNC29099.1 deoxyribonuclease V [Longimicrobium terrae]